MLIGVISDTHDKLETLEKALRYFHEKSVDVVIHCGDIKSPATAKVMAEQAHTLGLKMHVVLGNNDVAIDKFMSLNGTTNKDFSIQTGVLQIQDPDGKKISAYHGHHKPTLNRLLNDQSVNILLLGHTHKPRVEMVDNKLIVNPGSTAFAIPRSKLWRPTVAVVDTHIFAATIEVITA